MNKKFFENMRIQMNPNKKVVDGLYAKIENLPKSKTRTNIKVWRYGVMAATMCFIIALTIMTVPNLLNQNSFIAPDPIISSNNDEAAVPQTDTSSTGKITEQKSNTSSTEEYYEIPRWDDMTAPEKYSDFKFNGISYASYENKINESEIDKFLLNTTASGYDAYDNDKRHTINCKVYSLKSISTDCAVAVKYEGYEGYYPYGNPYYVPATLGDLIDGLNLRKNLVFNKIYYSYWKDGVVKDGNYISMEYTLPNTATIWDLLLSDTSLKNAGDVHYTAEVMSISIDVKVIGKKNISLAVNADGYIQTNILDTGKSFFIGKDRVQAFIDYVLKNGNGTVLESKTQNEQQIPE